MEVKVIVVGQDPFLRPEGEGILRISRLVGARQS